MTPAIPAAVAIAIVSSTVRNTGRLPIRARPMPSRKRSTAVPAMQAIFACSSGRNANGITGVIAAIKSAIPIQPAWT